MSVGLIRFNDRAADGNLNLLVAKPGIDTIAVVSDVNSRSTRRIETVQCAVYFALASFRPCIYGT